MNECWVCEIMVEGDDDTFQRHVIECVGLDSERSGREGELIREGIEGNNKNKRKIETNLEYLGPEAKIAKITVNPRTVVFVVEDILKALAVCEVYNNAKKKDNIILLASASTCLINSERADLGWGCGFRNLQMLMSAVRHMESFTYRKDIGTITQLQSLMEDAWRAGFDANGARDFNGKVLWTEEWIGASEVYALLVFLYLPARIIEFKGIGSAAGGYDHTSLMNWVYEYFTSYSAPNDENDETIVELTEANPIYIQQAGHSRLIVGVEKKGDVISLLLLDPGKPPTDTMDVMLQKEFMDTVVSTEVESRIVLDAATKPTTFTNTQLGVPPPPPPKGQEKKSPRYGPSIVPFRTTLAELGEFGHYQIIV